MNPKEDIINTLLDLSKISNRIRLDMLKNILDLPLLMFIDNVGDWINQYGFKLEQKFISFETEPILNLIEILDKVFKDWQISEKKYNKVDNIGKADHTLLTPTENIVLDHDSELQKYQILQALAFFNDVEAIKLYADVKFIIYNHKSNSELISIIPDEILSNTSKLEEIISLISKKISFDKFIGILNKEISSFEILVKGVDHDFLIRQISFKKAIFGSKTKISKFFYEEFINQCGIKPVNIIQINRDVFIFFSPEDYFVAKSKQKYFSKLLQKSLKLTILREVNTLLNVIIFFFPDAKLEKHFDRKKQVHSIIVKYLTNNNQIEPEVLNELIDKYIIFSDKVEFDFLRRDPNSIFYL